MTYRQEIEAIIVTFFYAYYKRYVEKLEIEHNELINENIRLKNQIINIKKQAKSNDDSKYRDMAIKLKKERDMYKKMYLESEKRLKDGNKNRIIQRSL